MKGPIVNPGSSQAGPTSASLIARVRAREPDAWVRLADLYGPVVYGWCRRRGLKEEDAADVVQEVFRALAGHIQDFKATAGGSFRGWLWTITRNKMLDFHRRAQRYAEAAGGTDAQARLLEIPETFEDSQADATSSGGLVRRALEMIEPDFEAASWQAFWRVTMEDQPAADVARTLGLSVNAVYIAKSRVLQRLRAELGEEW